MCNEVRKPYPPVEREEKEEIEETDDR